MMKKTILSAAIVTLLAAPALAGHEAGDFIVRTGVIQVAPDESSGDVLGLGELSVDEDTQVGLNFTYMLTSNWAVEVLAATPFSHDVSVAGMDVAEVTHLPPTVMAQYYFGQGKFRPYVGAGVNYTLFWDEEFNGTGKSLELSDLELDNSVGLAAQIGIDYEINNDWLVNASIWYIDIGTDVDFKAGGESVDSISLDIDPWVYMVSVGYSF
ncbi:outer membrane protein OmpW [Ferrimonas lipolytica]|uniref:Outer membrane protein W n=1 Tax=Ferrimonas lipolytica TaxID=2724191 RepID=A0A6H1U9E0_9GAMM|nr:outer membrane protein OmpW [Ferrimonas lipolytica]QIZ75644.1 outer membrane protein OmpW [Ferrimonas lipolytica]